MEREALLSIVASAFFGLVVWVAALSVSRAQVRPPDAEQLAWWRLLLPLFTGSVLLAFLLGWALQEPNPADENAGIALRVLAAFMAAIVTRALYRAGKSLRLGCDDARVAIGTVGLAKPRIIVSDEFRRAATGEVLAAALAHEAAHVRRRDPLRIWFAQLAADLQWPMPGTAHRLASWLLVLEAERDGEAVASGACAADLAEAILIAARLQCRAASTLAANVAGGGDGVAWRVRRLLAPVPLRAPDAWTRTGWRACGSCTALILGAVWLGVMFGDAVLQRRPGVVP